MKNTAKIKGEGQKTALFLPQKIGKKPQQTLSKGQKNVFSGIDQMCFFDILKRYQNRNIYNKRYPKIF